MRGARGPWEATEGHERIGGGDRGDHERPQPPGRGHEGEGGTRRAREDCGGTRRTRKERGATRRARQDVGGGARGDRGTRGAMEDLGGGSEATGRRARVDELGWRTREWIGEATRGGMPTGRT